MAETLRTVAEVASLLQLDIEAVHTLAQQHKLRGIKVHGQWRFTEADVRRWLQTQPHDTLPSTPAVS
jgi:excisionase family DNA binding protein